VGRGRTRRRQGHRWGVGRLFCHPNPGSGRLLD